jgi:hypothetical protein
MQNNLINIKNKKLDVVFVTKLDHLYTLNLSIKKLLTFVNVNKIHIVSQRKNFKYFNNFPKERINLIDENKLLLNMSFSELKTLKIPYFPQNAGWYFQQLLKIGAAFESSITDNYVVVDADTVFLIEPTFIDEQGRFLFVKAEEYHEDYFINYKRLFNEEPNREFSFISQYMVFNKDLVKAICTKIENNFVGNDSWYWKIMHNLEGEGGNLFSEYETYGHFVKNHYPDQAIFIDIPWLREGSVVLGSTFPNIKKIDSLRSKYHFISIELKSDNIYGKIKKALFSKIYPKYKYLKNCINSV